MSEAVVELPADEPDAVIASRAYAPYAQLIKMLLPRSTSVAIYDEAKELTWCSDGYERPEVRELIQHVESRAAHDEGRIHETSSGQAAYLAFLQSGGHGLGCVVVELGPSRTAWNETVVRGLLRPVLRCLENCLELEHSIEIAPANHDSALDLLMGVDEDNPAGPSPLHRLVRHSVEHLHCAVGALINTDKNIVVTWDVDGDDTLVSSELLSRTQKNLLAWAQLNNRTMLVNRVGTKSDAPSYKILSCPVHDANDDVTGVLALFREPEQPDFDLKDVRILEFIARRVVAIMNSRHDSLTGLPNKVIFESRVQAALRKPDEHKHALLYIDLDRLQSINEAFGYQSGDEVIQRLAEAVQQQLRPIDMASRLAGDRFAVFLPGMGLSEANAVAQSVVDRMAGLSYLREQQSLQATVSIGLVGSGGQAQIFSHFLAAAEIACKDAKNLGGNCVAVSKEPVIERRRSSSRPHVAEMLQMAISNNEFRLQAQPLVGLSISTGEIMGQEILLRMVDKSGNLLAPAKFLDLAHRCNLMSAIDRWVLTNTIQILRETGAQYPQPAHQITLNVSKQSLDGSGFCDFALNEIAAAGLPTQLFRFDLRESVAIEHVKLAAPFMRQMRDAGCQVGLDDFGVRLSSFADLKDLPVQYLKIDGSLIRRIEDDKYAESVVKGIAKAAEILGVFTIAEHVESESLANRLQDLDINFGQGFHFGRPRPAEAILGADLAEEAL